MSDYISREDVKKLLWERISLATFMRRGVPNAMKSLSLISEKLEEIPAADVRPVVYCRECRFWGGRNGKNECSLITSLADPRIWLKTQPDDFCSSGERREGGTP